MDDSGVIPGRVIADRFQIEERVGAGAMGVVFRATHLSLDKRVCVKVMHPELASNPVLAQRFHREAQIASRIDHPSSLRVIDFGIDDGLRYIVMEYLDGRDLLHVLAEEAPLKPHRIVDILGQLLAALAEAHDRGIVHRDIKPDNVMVIPESRDGGSTELVKICDYGIAQIVDPSRPIGAKLTRTGVLVGTPEYMAPEQARGEPLDARSDLYAVGIILYEMLTGRLPFEADTPLEVARMQIDQPPLAPSVTVPRVHRELESICLRALSKTPADRYATAREMRSALRSALVLGIVPVDEDSATDLSVTNSTFVHRSGAHAARRPKRFVVPTMLAMLVALLAGGSAWRVRHSAAPPATASLVPSTPIVLARATPTTAPPPTPPRETIAPPAPVVVARGPSRPRAIAKISVPSPSSTPAPIETIEESVSVEPAPAEIPPESVAITPRAPAPAPVEPAPVAAAPSPDHAQVEVRISSSNGATSNAFLRALGPATPKLTACYRNAIPKLRGPVEGVGVIHVQTDDVGVITSARLDGAFSRDLAPCMTRAALGGKVPNVDTGAANADVVLVYHAGK